MKAPAMYDHFTSVDSEYSDGIYRVVGVHEDNVTILLVTDADGGRINSGKVISVDRNDLGGFALSENPDRN